MGRSWALWGPSWASSGPSWRPSIKKDGSFYFAPPPSGPEKSPLGSLLGRSWGALGRSWGRLGGLLGPSWGSLGPSWGHLEASRAHRKQTSGKAKIMYFPSVVRRFVGLLGGSRGGSESTWGRLVALWGPLGGMLEAILHHLRLSWAILEAILEHWRPSWGHLGPSWRLQPLATGPVQVQGGGRGRGKPFPRAGKKGLYCLS